MTMEYFVLTVDGGDKHLTFTQGVTKPTSLSPRGWSGHSAKDHWSDVFTYPLGDPLGDGVLSEQVGKFTLATRGEYPGGEYTLFCV